MQRIAILFFLFSSLTSWAQIDHWESIIVEGDEWSYLLPSSQPDPNWTTLAFDDASWASGPSGFGYGDDDDQTIIPTALSIYLRKKFTVVDLEAIERLLMHLDFDDSYVAYLNGVEFSRALLDGNPPPFDQTANGFHEAALYQGQIPAAVEMNLDALLPGENILAIEVHNESITSSDFSAIPFLSVAINNTSYVYQATPNWFTGPVDFTETHLPLVMVNTNGQNINPDNRVMADLGIVYNGPGQMNGVNDTWNEYAGNCGIKIRGESSQSFDKKSFGFELWDEQGNDMDSSFLNFPKEEDFILYGPYSDKTLFNNVLAMHLANEMGHYSSRTRLVELLINGNYQGVYVLMEKIKRDNDRVDVATLKDIDIEGDELTGGYIFRIDKGDNEGWSSQYNVYQGVYKLFFQYYYPSQEAITNEQKAYIKDYMDDFESAMANPSGLNAQGRHYTQYINLGSFVDNFLLNELSKDVDAYRLSTYFHKDKDSKGGKITAGPFWDFNLSFGNGDYCSGDDVTGWEYYQCPGNSPFWWHNLLQDELFRNASRCRWEALRETFLSNENLSAYIDGLADEVGVAEARNFARWPILGTYVWPNPPYFANALSHAQVISSMKLWITERAEWIDENLNGLANNCELYDDPNYEITSADDIIAVANTIQVFPNPSHSNFTIISEQPITSLICNNALGQLQFEKSFATDKHQIQIDHLLAPGIYFLTFMSGETKQIQELIVNE